LGGQIDATLGQAAARGQFALFDKGRALTRWYQRHGAGSKGQGADGATAPRYPRKRLRPTRRGIEDEEGKERRTRILKGEATFELLVVGYRMYRRHGCLDGHPAIVDRQNSNKKGN